MEMDVRVQAEPGVLTGGVDVEALMRGFIEVLRSKYRSVEGSCRRSVTIVQSPH
jgi:hypothetical protein